MNELANKAFDLYVEMHRVSAADFMTAMEQNNVAGMKKANELLSMETMLLNIGVQHCNVKFQIPQHAESRQQEFGYISEDDGKFHAARSINWDEILDPIPNHGHTCSICRRVVVRYCLEPMGECSVPNDIVCNDCYRNHCL